MGKLLSTKNRALPAVDGYVLKGNTDGTSNFSFNVTDRSGSDVSVTSMQVTTRDSYEAPLQTFITSVS